MKRGPCSWALHALALCPALAYLTDSPPASAANLTCSAYSSCVSNLQNNHTAACAEARRENKNAACPPLSSQYIAQACGPAPNCAPVSGTVTPKFIVTNVIYAPPGSANKGSGSSVDYGSSSTSGVTTSVGSSFKSDYSLSASVSLSDPVALGISLGSEQFGVSTSTSSTSGSTSSLDVKKTTSSDVKVPGPPTDGIDHTYDEIWVLLDPVIGVQATGNTGYWVVGMNSRTVPLYAKVGWLKNPSTMPANVAQAFANAGCTSQDFATMLAQDPFAGTQVLRPTAIASQPTPDPTRYTWISEIPYEPDASGPSQLYGLKNDTTTTQGTSNSDSYTVGMSFSASVGFSDWIKASLSASSSWTWTNTSNSSNSHDQTQSASFTMVSPSPSYAGTAVDMQVYWDGVYGTFLFALADTSNPVLTGTVEAMSRPVPGADVVVTVGGRRIHAYADSHGVYRIARLPSGPVQISYGGNTQTATVSGTTTKVNFATKSVVPTQPSRPVNK